MEAEWEHAYRAGASSAWHCPEERPEGGDPPECVKDIAWYSANSDNKTHPVGEKEPNASGLYDMSGNVWEWVWDWFDAYPDAAVTDPRGPTSGQSRVYRGGSWADNALNVRGAYRHWLDAEMRVNDLGFRFARSVLP